MSTFSQFPVLSRLAIIALAFSLPLLVLAQEVNSDSTSQAETAGVVLAEISVHEAKIVSQNADQLTLSFALENSGSEPQFDIKFGVELRQDTAEVQSIYDTYVSEETLDLRAGERKTRTIEYPLATIAPGTYSVWIMSKTTGGVMLGLGMAGNITITNSDALEIQADTCNLTVTGETATEYNLYQGVDIAMDEELVLNCVIKNHSDEDKTFVPNYETHRRTIYGEKIDLSYPTASPTTLAAGVEEAVSFVIPKATEPQAYDISIALADAESKELLSNNLVSHYVLQGVSATIQTVDFDKTSYVAGENIALTLYWSPSADGFYDSRQGEGGTPIDGEVQAQVQVFDGAGNICSDPKTEVLTEGMMTINLMATSDCAMPAATVTLVGPDGETLDSRSIAVSEPDEPPVASNDNQDEDSALMLVAFLALAIVLVTILIYYNRRNKDGFVNGAKMLLVFTVAATGFMTIGVPQVEAVTWTQEWYIPSWDRTIEHVAAVNANKSTYAPGEIIHLSSVLYTLECTNAPSAQHILTATLEGVTKILQEPSIFNGHVTTFIGGNTFTAPSLPGQYNIQLTLRFKADNTVTTAMIPITVSGPVTEAGTLPPPPSSITATCAPSRGPQPGIISWTPAPGATHYSLRVDYYANDPSPHVVQIDNFTGTSYYGFYPYLDTDYTAWVYSCNSLGCSSNYAYTNFICAADVTAYISGTNCLIAENESQCIGKVNWTIDNATYPSVYHENTGQSYNNASATNKSIGLPYGINTFYSRNGDTILTTLQMAAFCEEDLGWNGNKCIREVEETQEIPNTPEDPEATNISDDEDEEAAQPEMVVTVEPQVVRQGQPVEVNTEITSSSTLVCTMYGAQEDPIVFYHTDPSTTQTYQHLTNPLAASKVITVTCTIRGGTGEISVSDEAYVEVLSTVEEI